MLITLRGKRKRAVDFFGGTFLSTQLVLYVVVRFLYVFEHFLNISLSDNHY